MSLPVSNFATADLVAAARAWHMRQPRPILDDPYAQALCGPALRCALRFRPLERFLFEVAVPGLLPVSMCVVMRARHAEQALERAVQEEGIRQYVIIGAGMDSFGFRRADLLARIAAFEVDHPGTQKKKLERIAKAGLRVLGNHHFVSADLSETAILEALAGTAFDMSQPTFFSLLGVAYYLTPAALAETARSISHRMPAGTRLAVDYLLDEASSDPATRPLRERMVKFVEGRGEPLRSAYSLAEMAALMAGSGFRPVESFALADLEGGYREEFGAIPFPVPGMFGFGMFEVG
ncbi:MAG: class I SAM-dependent methyltransferase [Bryobacterales bacterium]|nr:class I SAM-dependent methyltransferase [Bryobacterales bacterium]